MSNELQEVLQEREACALLLIRMRDRSRNSLFRSALTCAAGEIRARGNPIQPDPDALVQAALIHEAALEEALERSRQTRMAYQLEQRQNATHPPLNQPETPDTDALVHHYEAALEKSRQHGGDYLRDEEWNAARRLLNQPEVST